MPEDVTIADLVDIPEGSIVEHGISIVSYVDTDGDRSFALATHGEPWLGETLGLMRLAEHVLLEDLDGE